MPISKGVLAFARISLYVIAIFLATRFLIQHFVYPNTSTPAGANRSAPAAPDDPSFAPRFEAAKKLFQSGQYADALDAYRELQQAVPQLNDKEYESLKQARLEIAHAYETAGDSSSASNVYVAIVGCAMQQAKRLLGANQSDAAFIRSQDAVEFAHQVTTDQRLVVDRAMDLQVSTRLAARDLIEAAREQQTLIDYLEASGDRDELLAKAYANLGSIDIDAQQWDTAEQALMSAAEISDLAENREHSSDADYDRNFVDYQLVTLYLREGKNDAGLAKAEEYYAKYQTSSLPYKYHPANFASLGLQLARQSNNQDAIAAWQQKLRGSR